MKKRKQNLWFGIFSRQRRASSLVNTPQLTMAIESRVYSGINAIFLALVALALFFSFLIFAKTPVLAEDSENTDEENEELEEDIDETQKKIEEEEAKRQKLLNELNQIQGSVNRTSYEIGKTQSFIDETKSTISRKESEIKLLNEKIELQKVILTGLVREIYYGQNSLSLAIMPEKNQLSQFLGESDHLSEVERQIVNLIGDIKSSKEKIEGERKNLEENKMDHEKLLNIKRDQQTSLLNEKYGTQSNIAKKDATIRSLQQRLSVLRSSLSGFLGESFDAGDIVEAIKFASKKTGVRKEFLMAMLDKESDLGRFTGGCCYKQSGSCNATRMRDSDKEVFKDICEELDYDYKKKKVSCALSYGYGGAMGVAQFMPTTWTGYKSAITGYTGHNPPDPWNLTDGVVGMAEKLKRAGGNKDSGEHYAAKVYYCGGPGSSYWNTYCENYADTVISWSNGYDEYF